MPLEAMIATGATLFASLGGGAIVVFALSNWLGKVWADRMMQTERHNHAVQLEALRSSLQLASEEQRVSLQAQLEVATHARIDEHSRRVTAYKSVIDMLAHMIAKIEMIVLKKRAPLTGDEHQEFERERLRAYAYLAIDAPQPVMDAHDKMLDLVLEVIHDGRLVAWEELRLVSIDFLNAIREDLGVRTGPIAYNGRR